MSYETLDVECDRGIQVVRLNRPERLNAYNRQMHHELVAMYDAADADDDVRVVVVTGAGRAFCAGADLAAGGATFSQKQPDHQDLGGALNLRVFDFSKPVIAAINGPAVGIGATMTLPMDIRMISSTARVGFVFAKRGIAAEGCSSWFLPRVVGISRALEWAMTARLLGADEALAGGLVRSVHPPEDLLDAALGLAAEIVECAPVSVTVNRQLMWRMLTADHPMEGNRAESRAMVELGQAADAKEGVESFLEKRPARYPGRVPSDLPDFYPWWPERPFTPLG